MAIIDVDLGSGSTRVINSENADDGDVLNITALGDSELIVDGVDVIVGSIAGVQAGSQSTFTAKGGGGLTVDQGLLNVGALNSLSFGIEDNSHVALDGSSVNTLSGLNSYNVDFSGEGKGSFTYNEPSIGLLDGVSFNITGMQAGDELSLGGGEWQLDDGSVLNPKSPYREGKLHLENGAAGLLQTKVTATIEMTQEQYDEFSEDPGAFLSGGSFTQVCFAAGTMIATPTGEVAVEDLSIGDTVLTATGNAVLVKWIGRQAVGLTSIEQLPVCICQDALAPGKPNQDLVLTASHGIVIDDLVINASALVNYDTIDYIPRHKLPTTMIYYHIETEAHEVIFANGIEAETYIDYIDRQAFDNYDEYVELYGIETRIYEMSRQRISSRRLLPIALRQRLGIESAVRTSNAA